MEQRRGHDHGVAGPYGHGAEQCGQRLGATGRAALGPLGPPRRARGEDHGAALGAPRRQGEVTGRRHGGEVPARHGRRPGVGVGDHSAEVVVVDHHVDPLRRHDVGQLGGGETGVEVDDVGAQLRGRHHRLDEAPAVAGQDPDRGARPDPSAPQPGRHGVGAGPETPVGEGAVLVDHGRGRWVAGGGGGDGAGQGRPPPRPGQHRPGEPVGALGAQTGPGQGQGPAERSTGRVHHEPTGVAAPSPSVTDGAGVGSTAGMGSSGSGCTFGRRRRRALGDEVAHRLQPAEAEQSVVGLQLAAGAGVGHDGRCPGAGWSTVMSRSRSPDSAMVRPTRSAPSFTSSSATP